MHRNINLRMAAIGTVLVIATGISTAQADPTLSVYLSAPKTQTTIYNNTVTETFESLSTGNRTTDFSSAIGTYHLSTANPFNIQNDNQYGAGTGKYMAIGAQAGSSAPITLTLNTPQAYFGFSWNAGDSLNGLTFYSGGTFLGRFSTATLTSLLSNTTVTTLNNTVYNTSDYYGKPGGANAGSNSNEPYAFVNFVAVGGTFDTIIFDNSGSQGTGFESDNHTIRATAPTVDGNSVYATEVTTGAPEPLSLALTLSLGFPLIGTALIRRPRWNGTK